MPDTIGRPYSATDLDHPLIADLGCFVEYVSENGSTDVAVLANVTEDGLATLTHNDYVIALVATAQIIGRVTR